MEIIYFGDHRPSVPLATPMVLWQLHSTVLVLDNYYDINSNLVRDEIKCTATNSTHKKTTRISHMIERRLCTH